jgi:SAM-dependent methyltransferase
VMAGFRGNTGMMATWEQTYRKVPASDLPWNAGTVDADLKALLDLGLLRQGKAYDLGCGPGNDAAYLADRGWDVTAVDIAPAALALAKKTVKSAGAKPKVRFVASDVLNLKAAGDAVLVQDRGCFHTLPSKQWNHYVRVVAGLLAPGGVLALKVFSSKMAPGLGPYRFTRTELKKLFAQDFEWIEMKDSFFDGPMVKPRALFCVLRKKSEGVP